MTDKNKHYSYSLYADEQFAGEYEKDRFGSGFGLYLKNFECELYNGFIPQFSRLLDVGAGSGKLSLHFANKGYVVASDASFNMLLEAKRFAAEQNKTMDAVVCDAHILCFKDNSFDTVVSSRVIMHLVRWRTAVTEMCRVSSKTIVTDFPFYWSLTIFERIYRKAVRLVNKKVQSYRGFLTGTITLEFNKHKFCLVEKKKSFFLPVVIYRKLDAPIFADKLEKLFKHTGLTLLMGTPVTIKCEKKNDK